jgi:chaperone required for assembly of F1-ATPase
MRDLLNQLDENRLDPMRAAQEAMRAPLPRRFYREVDVVALDGQYGIHLDQKPVKTPAKRTLALPTQAAAELAATEFRAQEKLVDPLTMPVTRIANTTIDGVADNLQAVIEDIVKFAASDLLCYRADSPAALVEREAQAWDPLLDWMRDSFGANFILVEGVMPAAQPREAVAAFANRLRVHGEPYRIACIHTLTSLTGSAIAALAIAESFADAQDVWQAAHVDEDWNIEQWGQDEQAAERRDLRHGEFMAATNLLRALG